MSGKRVGIDIGANAVRVAEVCGVDREGLAQVTRAAIVAMPPGAVAGGRVKDPAQVAFALKRAIREAKVSPYGAVLGVASPDAALATVSMLGAIKAGEWGSVLRLENQQISPKVPMADSALSLNRVSSLTADDGTVTHTLLAAATLRTEVDAVMEVCRLAKVTPRAIDLGAAAAFRGLARVTEDDGSVATLVDVGATKVTVTTRQGAHLRSVRTIEAGGDRITRALMGVTSAGYEDAEARKRAMRIGQPASGKAKSSLAEAIGSRYGSMEEQRVIAEDTSDVAQESLTTSADLLIEDIAAAVEQDSYNHPAMPTQAVVLCGLGSLLQGMPERMQNRLGIPTFIGRPWVKVIPSGRTSTLFVDGVPDPALVLGMVSAVGLALWTESN